MRVNFDGLHPIVQVNSIRKGVSVENNFILHCMHILKSKVVRLNYPLYCDSKGT